ncbi:FMN-binding protein [Microbacterium sp. 2C]|uniref:FMN-binding protein n=1 Tax=Microbacterium paulum TaxID=2707006 RepID=UPI0018C29B9F|nr:FMN-binding protein [Microbacterium paulum]MBG0718753.1 FMN-binding protein [Microbacterium paulum]
MKKIVYGILATLSGLVLLFSYRTSLGEAVPTDVQPAQAAPSVATPHSAATPSASTTPTASASASASPSGAAPAATSGLTDGTFTGSPTSTRYGPVQVQITVTGGKIVDVQAVEYPTDNSRDRQINERAIPQLVSETLNAQSADIHFVSGATYTSQGYLDSLQSAIDQANA